MKQIQLVRLVTLSSGRKLQVLLICELNCPQDLFSANFVRFWTPQLFPPQTHKKNFNKQPPVAGSRFVRNTFVRAPETGIWRVGVGWKQRSQPSTLATAMTTKTRHMEPQGCSAVQFVHVSTRFPWWERITQKEHGIADSELGCGRRTMKSTGATSVRSKIIFLEWRGQAANCRVSGSDCWSRTTLWKPKSVRIRINFHIFGWPLFLTTIPGVIGSDQTASLQFCQESVWLCKAVDTLWLAGDSLIP